jgi:alpha-amylase
MVKWHNYVGNAKRANWYTDDANVIAFSKGSKGWVAFNDGTGGRSGVLPGRPNESELIHTRG